MDFGIALPATLRILSREMKTVVGWLAAGDVAPRTVTLETRIEEDLLGMIQAIRRLPPTTPPAPGTPLASDARERERELNRLIAEVTMIRMLQARLNDDTVGVDKSRPAPPTLPPAIRREVDWVLTREAKGGIALIAVGGGLATAAVISDATALQQKLQFGGNSWQYYGEYVALVATGTAVILTGVGIGLLVHALKR